MNNNEKNYIARWWKPLEKQKLLCMLCPRACVIGLGEHGFCAVRKNIDGQLYSLSYARPVALNIDPIEKKPLAEFLPGSKTFSLGTYGCNLNCSFCQNSSLARGAYSSSEIKRDISPEKIIELTISSKCKSVAFTYNEPTVFAEYAIDIAKLAHKNDLKTVLVSNGYITKRAAEDLYPLIDAANIDMKGFSNEFYTSMTDSKLEPVLNAIKYLYDLGKHIEITNLVIPGENDSNEMIDSWLDWVESELDKKVPLHFSAFFPAYKYNSSPPTPPDTLYRIKAHAQSRGFTAVYLGNI